MENILNLTPGQLMLGLALQVWMLVIFPVIVIRKLNYLTSVMESFCEDEEEGADNDATKSGENPA